MMRRQSPLGSALAAAIAAAAAACATGYGDGIDRAPDAGRGDNLDQPPPTIDAGPPIDAAPPPCTEGAARMVDPATGHCLIYVTTPASWDGADQACKALGATATLAVVQNQAENDILRSMIGSAQVWLGGNDKAVEGTFAWVDGTPWAFSNWAPGEPNNNDNEDCAVLLGNNGGKWNDRDCPDPLGYLCERR